MLKIFNIVTTIAVLSYSGLSIANVCYNDAAQTAPALVFIDNNDGTLTDNRTGLVWSACSDGQVWASGSCTGTENAHTWEQALEAAQLSNLSSHLGYSDWRLPNKAELASILELSCVNPAIDLTVFPDTPNTTFWTSTPALIASGNTRAWRVVFNYGNITLAARTSSYAVRLVRN